MFERATELDPEFSRAWAALVLSQAYYQYGRLMIKRGDLQQA